MWEKPESWLIASLAAIGIGFALNFEVSRLPQNGALSVSIMIAIVALFVAAPVMLYRAFSISGWLGGKAFGSKNVTGGRKPLVLYGIVLILLSIIWTNVSVRFVDPNTTASVVVVFGGFLMLLAAGSTLIMYRIWTRLRDLFF
jgi:hypothetical protein